MHGRSARSTRLRRTTRLLWQCALEALEQRRLLSVNVVTWHNDNTRQGLNTNEVALTAANVNQNTFGKLFTYAVEGQVYAQPLYVSNLAIPGQGTHNVVFVVTQHNDVYALDADSTAGSNNGVLWHVNLGPSAATPNPFFANRYGPYHDINPQVGITSTPVIDLATGTIYIDSFTNDIPGQNAFSHHVWALNLATGASKVAPIQVAAAIPGTSAGAVNGTLTFSAAQQLQRSALTLVNGVLYIAYTGYADTNPYHGGILGFNPNTLGLVSVFNTTPTVDTDAAAEAGEGGIWQAGNGLASDGSTLYVEVANGDFNAAATSSDWGDSFLKITPTPTASTNKNGYGLTVANTSTDYFTPFNEQAMADADQDLGSGGPMLLPDQPGTHPHLLVGAGKGGIIYLIDRDNMGGHTTTVDNNLQKVSLGHGVFSTPAYFNGRIYYHAVGDVLKAFSISSNGTYSALSAAPVASATVTYSSWGASPSISSNGNANGIIWDLQFSSTNEVLHAYDANATGSTLVELYSSNLAASNRDRLGTGVKFTTPTIADGKVFVGTDGALTIFGLFSSPSSPPGAPQNLVLSTATANQITLNWTTSATNETGFKIERSTNGVDFTQIGLASANAVSYADTTITPGVLYYYRVRATNTAGDSGYTAIQSAAGVGVSIPVSIYTFNEGAGTTAADIVGGNTGTLVGSSPPQWVAGRVGSNALSFTGTGSSASLVSAVQSNINLGVVLGKTASLSAWIKTTQAGNNTPTSAPAITGGERSGSTADVRWGYLDATGHIGISAGNNTGAKSTSVVNDGQWHHVAFTRNSSSGQVQVYVDGALQSTVTGDTGTKDVVFRLIGGQSQVQSGDGATITNVVWLNGQLDDIRIFDQVLSATEVQALAVVPSTPTGVTATALGGSLVQLNWTNVSAFAQNVEIDRRAGTSGSYQQIALVTGATTTFNDTGLTAGTQYFYQIRAIDPAGASAFTTAVSVTPPRPVIIGRYTFYNNSIYDGQNGSSNVADDRALAPDKTPLLPGQTASFANYTNYSAGLNGILIDFTNLESIPDVSDFLFRVGNDNTPDAWQTAPAPSYVTTYPGRGAGGSVRLELLWADHAIENQWLQVTVRNDGNINTALPDVFYLGNAIGETGTDPASARVDAVDELTIRAQAQGSVTLGNAYDINRDGVLDAADQLLARTHTTWALSQLQLIAAPGGAAQAEAISSLIAAPTPAPAAPMLEEAVPTPIALVAQVTQPQPPELRVLPKVSLVQVRQAGVPVSARKSLPPLFIPAPRKAATVSALRSVLHQARKLLSGIVD